MRCASRSICSSALSLTLSRYTARHVMRAYSERDPSIIVSVICCVMRDDMLCEPRRACTSFWTTIIDTWKTLKLKYKVARKFFGYRTVDRNINFRIYFRCIIQILQKLFHNDENKTTQKNPKISGKLKNINQLVYFITAFTQITIDIMKSKSIPNV